MTDRNDTPEQIAKMAAQLTENGLRDPASTARAWIIERLLQLGSDHAADIATRTLRLEREKRFRDWKAGRTLDPTNRFRTPAKALLYEEALALVAQEPDDELTRRDGLTLTRLTYDLKVAHPEIPARVIAIIVSKALRVERMRRAPRLLASIP